MFTNGLRPPVNDRKYCGRANTAKSGASHVTPDRRLCASCFGFEVSRDPLERRVPIRELSRLADRNRHKIPSLAAVPPAVPGPGPRVPGPCNIRTEMCEFPLIRQRPGELPQACLHGSCIRRRTRLNGHPHECYDFIVTVARRVCQTVTVKLPTMKASRPAATVPWPDRRPAILAGVPRHLDRSSRTHLAPAATRSSHLGSGSSASALRQLPYGTPCG